VRLEKGLCLQVDKSIVGRGLEGSERERVPPFQSQVPNGPPTRKPRTLSLSNFLHCYRSLSRARIEMRLRNDRG
jgi:hypothetical protein